MEITLTWYTPKYEYATGQQVRLGKKPVNIGGFHWRASRSRDDQNVWEANCKLPGLKPLDTFKTEAECRAAVEDAVRVWFKNATGTECTVVSVEA